MNPVQYNIPEEDNTDPFREQEPGMPNQLERYEAERKRQLEIRKNIERVKSPI